MVKSVIISENKVKSQGGVYEVIMLNTIAIKEMLITLNISKKSDIYFKHTDHLGKYRKTHIMHFFIKRERLYKNVSTLRIV